MKKAIGCSRRPYFLEGTIFCSITSSCYIPRQRPEVGRNLKTSHQKSCQGRIQYNGARGKVYSFRNIMAERKDLLCLIFFSFSTRTTLALYVGNACLL